MARLTGGQAVVKSLINNGVDTVFGLPGIQLDHLFNALYDDSNSIRVLNARHEQGTAYMAFGYAQASGRVGTFAVVPGPGLLNTTAALATAYGCNSPVLALTGQIPAPAIDQGYGLLHEIPDQLGLVSHLTKDAMRIGHASSAPQAVNAAFQSLLSGVRGPVEVEMALDLLAETAEVSLLDGAAPLPTPPVDTDRIDAAAKLLGAARNPMIVCGGGALDASAEVLRVAQMLQAPVVTGRLGRGVVSDAHYLSQPQPMGHRLWKDVDVVLAVGTRFQQYRQVWGVDDDIKVVRIDLNPTQMHRISTPDVGLVADAADALTALADALESTNRKRESREAELTALNQAVRAEIEQKLAPQVAFIKAIRAALPDDGIYCDELTQVSYVARSMLPVYEPRTFIASGYQGTLGSGYPTALGAKVAMPDRPVLSVSGDGGFMFNVQELSSAAQHGINAVAVVFNDGAYGNVRRMQEDLHGGRVIATGLKNPDFVKLAESFDVAGVRADSPAALQRALEEAFQRTGPTLIDVPIGKVPEPFGVSMPMARGR
ncbi:MAG: thiamine pyrophosphate-dependent enzyme [Pseudomonadota bacterium]